jgi:hydroxymethylglutaryl-CoA synthase
VKQVAVGIDRISFYVPHYYLELETLALARNLEASKFTSGLGQHKMAVVPPDEDIVTMGANAAEKLLQFVDPREISTILFATESSIDQSKAAGIYVHHLLNLPSTCRVIELKQACYGATGSLQLAASLVASNPSQKVLVIASDIAKYGLEHLAEPTQGCGAVAMMISSDPRLLVLESGSGLYTDDVMDFWRPNYAACPFVEGKYSSFVYLHALEAVWKHYQFQTQRQFSDLDFCCYHAPVPRLVEKAHKVLTKLSGVHLTEDEIRKQLFEILKYAREIGNTYTASLYISFISLLANCPSDLQSKRIGFYSYGSGCVAEYFTGIVQPGYHRVLNDLLQQNLLESRQVLSYDLYEQFYRFSLPEDGSDYRTPKYQTGLFRLSGIQNHQRNYEKVL